MPMSEMTGIQRRVEMLEDELRDALKRLSQLEAKFVEEDLKVRKLEREVQHEHQVLDRLEHGSPVGL